MAVQWTPEQKKVIESRDRNLLVAAAAGSGKTAVLVQHILEMVADPAGPVQVTELLVVTFTRAAASEMKERLRTKLAERLEEEPWNLHIQKQITLLDQAHICTIDSFCQWMVKNYFYRLDLDPDFRVPDEGEGKLIREEILDSFFEEGNEDYFRLMDAFGTGKGDRAVRELIESLYLFADSAPWPGRWLTEQLDGLSEETGALDGGGWTGDLMACLRRTLTEYREILAEAAEECLAEPGLEKYGQMFRLDLREVEDCLRQPGLPELLARLGGIKFSRKPLISRKLVVDEGMKAGMSSLRDAVKTNINKLMKRFAVLDPERAAEWMRASATYRQALLRLTLAFSDAYRQAKRERNLADFADIEHWALDLLVEWRDGRPVPTPLAAELGDSFREIIVDEYQDSNRVQETILHTLSGEDRGHPNMFMVGDVKQSIYKFRMARPELFMEKYRRFSYEPLSSGQKIDLSRNFRSRGRILREVNGIFFQIMGENLGGVEYDEHAALYYGASYPEGDETVELLLAEQGEWEAEPVDLEGKMIAGRIRELMENSQIWDEGEKQYRAPEYRDIVVLLRTMEGWADRIAAVLNQEGIPAYAQLKKGYFAAVEVQVLLNFLRVLDNPLQDIPLASVMVSPIGGFTMEELARMTAGTGEGDFYHRCQEAAEWGRCPEKWQRFRELLARYRREDAVHPIHEILERLLEETDYGLILAAEPGGSVRRANVEMLMEKAMAYEETSYHGIFHFIQYVEKLQQYQVDYGEAQTLSENENLVRITSIHRSKGLEYPIVIVAGMGKQFNLQDARKKVLIHEDLGLACDAVDVEKGVVYPTLWKRVVADRIEGDIRGEELRILYVAMTRAKEKLILAGTCASWEKLTEKWVLAGRMTASKLPSFLVGQANSFLDWIAMSHLASPSPGLELRAVPVTELATGEVYRQGARDWQKEEWRDIAAEGVQDEEFRKHFREICGYVYPWQSVCRRKAALSVSELKHRAMEENLGLPGDGWRKKPAEETVAGARRGTVYHSVMERIPPEEGGDAEAVARRLKEMTEAGILTVEEAQAVDVAAITGFYTSGLGRRMAAAAAEGRVRREQTFVMRLPLREVLPEPEREGCPEEEWVLVQGIIDAFLEEEDGIVLWDYKTDAVSRRNGEARLLALYREQLLEYKKALEMARGRKVKEMWIYSFTLRKAIPVPE